VGKLIIPTVHIVECRLTGKVAEIHEGAGKLSEPGHVKRRGTDFDANCRAQILIPSTPLPRCTSVHRAASRLPWAVVP